MNKPAPKEPSMDEILSSIRQIIADDDAAANPRPSLAASAPAADPIPLHAAIPPAAAAPEPARFVPPSAMAPATEPKTSLADVLRPLVVDNGAAAAGPAAEPEADEDGEPLALSPAQILADDNADEEAADDEAGSFSFGSILADQAERPEPAAEVPEASAEPEAPLVDPEDLSFASEPEPFGARSEPAPANSVFATVFAPEASAQAEEPAPSFTARPSAQVADAAPMPDRNLTRDLTEQLIEPATNAAVRQTFSKLHGLGIGTQGLTIEQMIREMLRPMLKEWLDENLPSMVEHIVEREISRISRGVD